MRWEKEGKVIEAPLVMHVEYGSFNKSPTRVYERYLHCQVREKTLTVIKPHRFVQNELWKIEHTQLRFKMRLLPSVPVRIRDLFPLTFTLDTHSEAHPIPALLYQLDHELHGRNRNPWRAVFHSNP